MRFRPAAIQFQERSLLSISFVSLKQKGALFKADTPLQSLDVVESLTRIRSGKMNPTGEMRQSSFCTT